jgi:exosortase
MPFVLLMLAVPLPALLFNQVALPLQFAASRLGVGMLDLAGVAALREGNIIVLDQATLEVAEACSGVRSLVSLLTLALFYGHLGAFGPAARVAVLVGVVPVVVVLNGLRVATTGWFAHAYGRETAFAFLHGASGWLFFAASVLLLVAIGAGVGRLVGDGRQAHAGLARPS